jgi:hypothetical protein
MLPPLTDAGDIKDALSAKRTRAPKSVVPGSSDEIRALKQRAAKLNTNAKTIAMNVSVPLELYRKLIELAEEHHRSIHAVAREALTNGARMYTEFITGQGGGSFVPPSPLRAHAKALAFGPIAGEAPEPQVRRRLADVLQPPEQVMGHEDVIASAQQVLGVFPLPNASSAPFAQVSPPMMPLPENEPPVDTIVHGQPQTPVSKLDAL